VPDYSPTVRRRRLAAELKKLREQSGQTGDQIAEALGWSASKISRYELARTGLKPADVRRLLDYYGVDVSRRGELLALAREATGKGWWEAYSDVLPGELADLIGLEDEARSSLIWQIECVPGLLQTEEYARQVNSGFQLVSAQPPSSMERRVQVRMRRQQVLARDPPLEILVVLDESALLRQVADQAVMRAQLERLLEAAKMPNVSIRVLPLHGKRPIMAASFVLLTFGEAHDAAFHDVVSTENWGSTVHFHGELDTYLYRLTFDHIIESALSATESTELIKETAATVWRLPSCDKYSGMLRQ
jgi:transcriptional regulator with XRE-family HTH domain